MWKRKSGAKNIFKLRIDKIGRDKVKWVVDKLCQRSYPQHRLRCGLKRRYVKLLQKLKKGKEKRHSPSANGKCLIGAGMCVPVTSNFYSYYTATAVGGQVPSVL